MKKSANNQFTIFSWLKEIFINKSSWDKFTEDQIKELNPYMIISFISMNNKYIELANFLQTVNYQNKEQFYKICCNLFPKDYKYYAPYVKSKKTTDNVDLKIHLTKYFECSTREIEDYLDILSKDIIIDILHEMAIDDKQIKKLIK